MSTSTEEFINNLHALGMSREGIMAMVAKLAAAKSVETTPVVETPQLSKIDIITVTDHYLLETFRNKEELTRVINGLIKVPTPIMEYGDFSEKMRNFYERLLGEIRSSGLNVFSSALLADIYFEAMASVLAGNTLNENTRKFISTHHEKSFGMLTITIRTLRARVENAVKIYVKKQGHLPCQIDEYSQLSETEILADTRSYPHLNQWLKSQDLTKL